MRLRGIIFTVTTLLSLVLLLLNWRTVTEYLPVNLVVFTVRLPLGLVLLGLALGLSLFFFFASLLDHARQLRRINQHERQIETLQGRLDQRQQEEIKALNESHNLRFDALEEKGEAAISALKADIMQALEASDQRRSEQLDAIRERVLLVRNELAADIAKAEDSVKREVTSEEVQT